MTDRYDKYEIMAEGRDPYIVTPVPQD
eukprot:gene26532-biopygen16774